MAADLLARWSAKKPTQTMKVQAHLRSRAQNWKRTRLSGVDTFPWRKCFGKSRRALPRVCRLWRYERALSLLSLSLEVKFRSKHVNRVETRVSLSGVLLCAGGGERARHRGARARGKRASSGVFETGPCLPPLRYVSSLRFGRSILPATKLSVTWLSPEKRKDRRLGKYETLSKTYKFQSLTFRLSCVPRLASFVSFFNSTRVATNTL